MLWKKGRMGCEFLGEGEECGGGVWLSGTNTKTISYASHMQVHHSFLMWCMGPVIHRLCCSLGLLGKTPNNVARCSPGSLGLKCFIFLCGDVFAESQHRLQTETCLGSWWASLRASLLSPLAWLLHHPVLALLCCWWLQTPSPLWEGARRGRLALAGPVMPGKSR